METCPACGRENPADARFCNACGAPLAAAPALRREERKLVTVLFADLVGFTSRAERLDPEDVRALLAPYWQHLRDELERFGGTVEKFIGDAVVALFGAPVAHEDDPYRAVRAALAIRDWARDEEEIQVRVAVNTGEALVQLDARPGEGEGMATGDVINTAARLQAAAPVNGVLVGESTYRATRDLIDYGEHEPVVAKGKTAPLPVWEAVGTRFVVETTPSGDLVGRRHEVEHLVSALERVRREREPQLVTIAGVPGIGKSRLVAELFAILDADPELMTWRQGRSLPYGEGVSFWALGEIVKAELGVFGSDSREAGETKVREALAELLADEGERSWVADHLRPLLGLGEAGGDDRAESFAAWRRFVEALAERRPVVLVFEDLQWADDAMLDFVDELPEWVTGVPLLVVCTTRPELFERRPGWGGGKRNALTISLVPLTDEETSRVVAAVLDQPLMDAETQQILLERAGGNPLYAEQYARMVAEGLERTDLPETVQGIIAARLDLLSPDEKAFLQEASVIGRIFWPGAIGASERELHALVRKEFIRRERRSSLVGEAEYAFAHALVRDVAYGQIPRGARVEKHRRAANWIETLPADRATDRAELLAHHYSAALELAAAAGLDPSAFVEPARLAFREAGDRAVALVAYQAADRHYSAALELWPEDDPQRPYVLLARGKVRHATGNALPDLESAAAALLAAGDTEAVVEAEITAASWCWYSGDRDAADTHAQRALALVDDAPPTRAKAEAMAQWARLLMLRQDFGRAKHTAMQALELAEALGLERLQASALITHGTAAGDPDDLRQGIALAERAKIYDQWFRGMNNLGELQFRTSLERVAEIYARMRAAAERLGYASQLIWIDGQEASLTFVLGDWDRALELAESVIALAEAQGGHYQEQSTCWVRAQIRYARGDVVGAIADVDRGVEVGRRAKDPQAVGPAVALQARLYAREGRSGEASALLDELIALCTPGGRFPYFTFAPTMLWAAVELGRVHELAPFVRTTEDAWDEAVAAAVRDDFVGAAAVFTRLSAAVDAAEAALVAARRLLERGDRASADAQLAVARNFYRRVGATERLRAADALLAATA